MPAGRGHADVTAPGIAVERLPLPATMLVPALALLGCVAAAAFAWWLAGFAPEVSREPALANLLRGMALLKGLAVLVAVALLSWRVRYGLSAGMTAMYLVPCWVAGGAAMLIGQLAFVAAAAVAFHAAEITFLFAAWRDSRSLRAGRRSLGRRELDR
jgi:hypothetical protein